MLNEWYLWYTQNYYKKGTKSIPNLVPFSLWESGERTINLKL